MAEAAKDNAPRFISISPALSAFLVPCTGEPTIEKTRFSIKCLITLSFNLQNDRITKLKIDNNPFAKGFRELGQSRIKRKLSSKPAADATSEDCKSQENSFQFSSDLKENQIRRKRSNSLTGSTTSADDSANSLGDEIASPSDSGTSSPATSAHEYTSPYDESEEFSSAKYYNSAMLASRSNEWFDLMSMRYFPSHSGTFQPPLYLPPIQPQTPLAQQLFPMQRPALFQMPAPNAPALDQKKSSFSISAILGRECWKL